MSNQVFASKSDALKLFRELGKGEGEGKLKRPEFAIKLALAAQEGHFNDTEAGEAWNAFRDTVAKKLTSGGAVDGEETSATTRKSECKTIITVAQFPNVDLPSVLTRAKPLVTSAESPAKGPLWDRLVKVTRRQKDKPEGDLTDAEIIAAVTPEEAKAKDEMAQLKAIHKSLEKLINGTKSTDTSQGKPGFPSDEAEAAFEYVGQRIARLELGIAQSKFNTFTTKRGA